MIWDMILFYPARDSFDLVVYVDAYFVGYKVDMRNIFRMPRVMDFMGSSLISWGIKKQNSVALATYEAKYVAATSCCAQLLWIKQQQDDLEYTSIVFLSYLIIPVNMWNNLVQHQRKN